MLYNIRSDAIQCQIPDFLSDGNSNFCIFHRLLVEIALEKFDFEKFGQCQGVQNLQYPIRWQISTPIDVIPDT